jgi:hypothetical protein
MNFTKNTIYDACKNGDIKTIQDFLTSEDSKKECYSYGHNMVTEAIKGNHFDIVKTIYDSKFKLDEITNINNVEKFFQDTLKYNTPEIFKFLLHYFETDEKIFQRTMKYTPMTISRYGQLDNLKYLFANYSDNKYLQDNLKHGDILAHACENGNLNIIKYILSDDQLKRNVDIHIYDELPFKYAYDNNRTNVIEYFIFDLDIELNQHIKNKVEPDSDAFKMFSVRELAKSLEQDKPGNKTTRKAKI